MAEIRKVDPEVMTEQANKLGGLKEDWRAAVNDITALKQDLDAMWDGLANDEFNARWEEDLKKYEQLLEVLEGYIGAVTEAVAQYEQYEQDIAAIVREN